MNEPTTSKQPTVVANADQSSDLPNSNLTMRTVAKTALASVMTSATLTACGGGGGSATAAGGGTVTVTPTVAEAARFLLQAQFSASDAEIAAVQAQGYNAWLDAQFAKPIAQTGWDWQMAKGYNTATYVNAVYPADHMAWQQLIASPDALRKRVAIALSEIFVVSSNGVPIASRSFAMAAYWDVLNTHAFGNYRALLEDITLNPAMGVYLNVKGNQKASAGRAPDENYAREVLQLFSIGLYKLNADGSNFLDGFGKPVETYTQDDITQLARVFTGYDYDNTGGTATTNPLAVKNPMKVNNALHETGASTFLGVTVPTGASAANALKTALDTIANHPNVPPFIANQLIQRLVTSNPSKAYVARVSAVFINNGAGVRGDLKAVIKAILQDTEARSSAGLSQNTFGKLREPMLRLVQWARTFDAQSPGDTWIVNDLSDPATRLGQSPLRSPSVFNFFRPGYVPPNTVLAAQALTAPEMQLTNESTVAGYLNYMTNTIKNGHNNAGGGIAPPAYTAELGLVYNPSALVARLNLLLTANQLSSATAATIVNAIGTIATTTLAGQQNRVYAAILLVMACPEYLVQK